MKKVLEKNPILATHIGKKHFDMRLFDIAYKMLFFVVYLVFKPIYIKNERDLFYSFLQNENVLSIADDTAYLYLPNLKWENGQVVGEYIQKKVFYSRDYYERAILNSIRKYISEEGVVLDIGANIGNHTVYFAKVCKASKIYAFEPIEGTFKVLQKNIELNKLASAVILKNAGVGSSSGHAEMSYYDEANLGSSQITVNMNGSIDIVSIDEMEIEEKVTFVKIDVEGGEYGVILGMNKKIQEDKPVIFVEIWEGNFEKVNNLLENMSYGIEYCVGHNYLYKCKEN